MPGLLGADPAVLLNPTIKKLKYRDSGSIENCFLYVFIFLDPGTLALGTIITIKKKIQFITII